MLQRGYLVNILYGSLSIEMDIEGYMEMDPAARVVLVAMHLLDVAQEEGWLVDCDFTTEEGAEVAAFAMSNGERPTQADLFSVAEYMLTVGLLEGASAENFAEIMMCALDTKYPQIDTLDT